MPYRRFAGQSSIFRFSTLTFNNFYHLLLDEVTDVLLDGSVPLVGAEVASCAAGGAICVPDSGVSKNTICVVFMRGRLKVA